MDTALGYPTHDPHGDPIPSRDGVVEPRRGQPLHAAAAGDLVRVVRVSDRDPDRLRYLGVLGLYPEALVEVVERMPFEGPLRIRVGGAEHVIGRPLASAVMVVAVG
jgi:DtxR family Mn-dependent transcriptional regulator